MRDVKVGLVTSGEDVMSGEHVSGQVSKHGPPAGELAAVAGEIGVAKVVGDGLGVGRPSARCLRVQVLFRRPPTRTGRARFPGISALQ